jgi:hypothetical protein
MSVLDMAIGLRGRIIRVIKGSEQARRAKKILLNGYFQRHRCFALS